MTRNTYANQQLHIIMVIWTLTWLSSLCLCCFVQTNYTQVICIIYGCGTRTLTLHWSVSHKALSLFLPWLNSYCPHASLRGNWHPRSHFLSTTWIFFLPPWFPVGCLLISLFPNSSKSKKCSILLRDWLPMT
jgi:hypothetical protein